MGKVSAHILGKKLLRKWVAICIVVLAPISIFAQQKPQFTHYMYNTLSVNPAYAGSSEALTITGITRHQWVGLEGAPTTQTITMHTPILSQHIGLGMTLLNDRIGPNSDLQFSGDFAYRMPLGEDGTLSLGLKAGAYYRSTRLSELATVDEDASFSNNARTKMIPNVGFGAYYVQSRYYVGVSIPNLLESDFYQDQVQITQAQATERRHYYLIAGAFFDLGPDLQFKPSTMIKAVPDAPIEVDVTANFLIREKLWLGAMYRMRDAVGILAAFSFTEQLKVGYSFDLPTSALLTKSIGTHEVMLTYDFKYAKKAKVRSPRYF
ncbi:MAG: type IX secretion system membrane protein PorP/SprF [Flavobacteriales bacterium]|nr:type IX secretion system membrane protein PorP/SprF [Flavobacteriales bacterium]